MHAPGHHRSKRDRLTAGRDSASFQTGPYSAEAALVVRGSRLGCTHIEVRQHENLWLLLPHAISVCARWDGKWGICVQCVGLMEGRGFDATAAMV